MLAKLAIGTPRPLVDAACDRMARRQPCTVSADGHELVYQVTTRRSAGGLYESRLRVTFRFDPAGNLADVVPVSESSLFGVVL